MRKEVLELRQDPRLFGIVVMAPIIQLTVLGYAATTDVKDVPVVIVDADRSVRSRELITRFEASDNFTIVGLLGSTREIDPWLESGRAWMALNIRGKAASKWKYWRAYSRNAVRGSVPAVQAR